MLSGRWDALNSIPKFSKSRFGNRLSWTGDGSSIRPTSSGVSCSSRQSACYFLSAVKTYSKHSKANWKLCSMADSLLIENLQAIGFLGPRESIFWLAPAASRPSTKYFWREKLYVHLKLQGKHSHSKIRVFRNLKAHSILMIFEDRKTEISCPQ